MSDIAVRPGSDLNALPVDYNAVLKHLGLSGADPKSQAVVLVCQRYNLDPVLKHVVLVDGNVYVTRDGLLHIAHASGQYDGMEVAEAVLSEDGKEWRSRATVWRKDMGRPTTLSGRYRSGSKNSPEMAEKVAVARSLKHAFDVAIATEDERQAMNAEPARRVTTADVLSRKPAELPAAEVHVDTTTGEMVTEDPDVPGWADVEVRKPTDS